MSTIFEIPSDANPDAPLSELSDEALLLRYRNSVDGKGGDRQAFEALVHRYEKELYSYLRRFLGDATLAEDVFQATFLQVHLKCGQFEFDKKVRPWLYTIATHQAIDAQRRNKRHRMVSLDQHNHHDDGQDVGSLVDVLVNKGASPASALETVERRKWIREAVAALPESLRSAVTLIYYQGLKYHEAADILAIPVGTVKSRMHTAVLKLHEAWNRANSSSGDR
jgi:RNA polymerase sigma-70 factor (ECF subfamily)